MDVVLLSLRPPMRFPKLSKFAKVLLRGYGVEKKITVQNSPKTKLSMMTLDSDIKMVKLY